MIQPFNLFLNSKVVNYIQKSTTAIYFYFYFYLNWESLGYGIRIMNLTKFLKSNDSVRLRGLWFY